VLPDAAWQRCYVHFLRNALDSVPRKVDDDCLQELRWFYDRRDLAEVRRDIATWLGKWQAKYPRLCNWVEDNIEETLTYYRLPLPHHKHMKSTNMLEQLNQELKRHTHVVRIFPNAESCLRWCGRWPSRCTRTGRSHALPQHGPFEGAQEGGPAGLGRLTTTMAAMLGAAPLAIGFGEGAELRRPLGISIVGGLIVSQLLTLYTTPVIYLYLDRLRLSAQRRWRRRYFHLDQTSKPRK
jgi:hypothetical protein